jgi:hypothetical protein
MLDEEPQSTELEKSKSPTKRCVRTKILICFLADDNRSMSAVVETTPHEGLKSVKTEYFSDVHRLTPTQGLEIRSSSFSQSSGPGQVLESAESVTDFTPSKRLSEQ